MRWFAAGMNIKKTAMQALKLKVCGMKYPDNIRQVAALGPHYMGFIFYPPSSRYMAQELPPEALQGQTAGIQRVGVFVNADTAEILRQARAYQLQAIQLHGQETPAQCRQLRQAGLQVIKVFSVGNAFDFSRLQVYKLHCDFFLFDTKGKLPGGNGLSFNWNILKDYDNELPFFLSGGIELAHIGQLQQLRGLRLHALDINSRFESSPGRKQPEKIKQLIEKLESIQLL